MTIKKILESLMGSYVDPNSPVYKKSVKDFKKNLLAIDYEKKLTKKKKKLGE